MNLLKATGLALNLKDLFINFPFKKLKITCTQCKKIFGDPHREAMAMKVFKEHVKMVINDVIDNNVTFQLPTGSRKCEIHMQTFKDEKFKNMRRGGKWRNVDFLKTLFTGCMLGFYMYSPNRPTRIKNIYINKELKDKIDNNINNGKTYC